MEDKEINIVVTEEAIKCALNTIASTTVGQIKLDKDTAVEMLGMTDLNTSSISDYIPIFA